MFQNHLLELLCLISMEIPKSNTSDMIRDEKLKVLKKIKKINTKTDIIRGQYIESEINGRKFSSYRKNKGVNKVSNTETFFACKLLLEQKISLKGVRIPVYEEIYRPILKDLEAEGIEFTES